MLQDNKFSPFDYVMVKRVPEGGTLPQAKDVVVPFSASGGIMRETIVIPKTKDLDDQILIPGIPGFIIQPLDVMSWVSGASENYDYSNTPEFQIVQSSNALMTMKAWGSGGPFNISLDIEGEEAIQKFRFLEESDFSNFRIAAAGLPLKIVRASGDAATQGDGQYNFSILYSVFSV